MGVVTHDADVAHRSSSGGRDMRAKKFSPLKNYSNRKDMDTKLC
jgi:hypothetical protein